MVDSDDLAADLHGLYRAGKVTVPHIANLFVEANGRIAATSGAGDAFAQVGDKKALEYDAWASLRDSLQTYVGHSAEHLHHVGEGLIGVMEHYRDTDECAADRLAALIKEDEELGEVMLPDEVGDYSEPTYPKDK